MDRMGKCVRGVDAVSAAQKRWLADTLLCVDRTMGLSAGLTAYKFELLFWWPSSKVRFTNEYKDLTPGILRSDASLARRRSIYVTTRWQTRSMGKSRSCHSFKRTFEPLYCSLK